jgi:hypothetical protein
MTNQQEGGALGLSPFLGVTPNTLIPVNGFQENLKVGNQVERKIRGLLALNGLNCYGTEPGKHEDDSAPNYAKEQKDIVLYRESLFISDAPWNDTSKQFSHPDLKVLAEAWREQRIRNNIRVVEVKSFSKPFYPSIMLDCAKTWKQKEVEPTAVVLVQQNSTLEELSRGEGILVAHITTVREHLKEVTRTVWNKATQDYIPKTNIEVPQELCWPWEEFIELALKWQEGRELHFVPTPLTNTNFTKGPST